MQLYEWATKNIKGIHFFYISSENVSASCVKFDFDKWYSFASTIDKTRSHHCFIPVSMNSIEMWRTSFDTFSHITFGHIDTDTSMLQPGRYIACLCDGKWYIGIIMDRCDESNYVKVKFMRHDRLCLSWYQHHNQCWVPFQHILSTVTAPQLQGRSGQQYSPEKEDYNKINFIYTWKYRMKW